MLMKNDWTEKVKEFCQNYNIPLYYLADTLYEPKVVPMIRGKAFEFSAMLALQEYLPKEDWEVVKVPMNAQSGLHDVDVRVTHKATGKIIRIECKLAKKGSFKAFPTGASEIRVKCMRSRTLGTAKVKELAPKLGIDPKVLTVHNDQYLPSDFDVVITSIGNAFYQTEPKTGIFLWEPSKQGISFLTDKLGGNITALQQFAFSKMYIVRTSDIKISTASKVCCTRSACKNRKNCNFIPNYPIIKFAKDSGKSINGWSSIDEALSVFDSFL